MRNENVHPVFGPILDSIYAPDPIDRLFQIAKDRNDILLQGYNELIDLLKTPGNIDKQTLMQSIGRTLKNAAK